MAKLGCQFDNNGFYVSDFLEGMELPLGHILFEGYIPNGLYKPRLVNNTVIEGLTEEEINFIKNTPVPLTPIEELRQENNLLKAKIQANADRADFQEELIVEMAMIVYP
jgi:hypothetical protein